jgi:hypothetical protein
MVGVRSSHTAILLNNGKVLISGGAVDAEGFLDAGPELYDPSTGAFGPVELAGRTMGGHRSVATPLFNGKILIVGGVRNSAATLYDPATNTVESLSFLTPPQTVALHTATLLPTGKVLIAGGLNEDYDFWDRPKLYDPGTGTFQTTQSFLTPRYNHTATPLLGGLVLIAGGAHTSTAELFDPYTETFRLTGSMASSPEDHTATLLNNGTVLITGGNTATAEIYLPPLLTFDGGHVQPGDSFTATFSGTKLNNETYYDLRFSPPGVGKDYVAANWQRGPSATHSVGTGIATGAWTVTGVRAHQRIDDHTADFVSVSVELLVTK